MKYRINKLTLFILTFISLVAGLQLPAYASGTSSLSNPIVITEMLPGTEMSASEEFIEIYNQSKTAIDLAKDNWVIQIASSKATTWSGAKSVKLTGTLYPGTYAIVTSTYTSSGVTKSYLSEYANAQFSAGLTASSGHIRIGKTALAPATGLQLVDIVEWSTKDTSGALTSPGIDEAVPFTLGEAIKTGSSIKRILDTERHFIASGDPVLDFMLSSCPSPTSNSVAPSTPIDPMVTEPLSTMIDTSNPSCAPIEETPGDEGGAGSIVQPTNEPPAILLPSATSAVSTSTVSGSGASIPASDKGLQSPQITELLPNPGSPNTDAADEFVELYNNNDAAFDLSGFMLYIGSSGSKHVTFPDGTTIAPHSFKAFFSSDLHLSLSNSAGKVSLVDPLGNQLYATDDYGTAKDDTAWALAQGKWQWTSRPTPGATNIITTPMVTGKKTPATKAKTSKASTKAATTKHKTKAASVSDMAVASSVQPDTPLHPLTLAVVGSFALLYGAYEYRRDLANRFHQLRGYRAARRAARAEPEGR